MVARSGGLRDGASRYGRDKSTWNFEPRTVNCGGSRVSLRSSKFWVRSFELIVRSLLPHRLNRGSQERLDCGRFDFLVERHLLDRPHGRARVELAEHAIGLPREGPLAAVDLGRAVDLAAVVEERAAQRAVGELEEPRAVARTVRISRRW